MDPLSWFMIRRDTQHQIQYLWSTSSPSSRLTHTGWLSIAQPSLLLLRPSNNERASCRASAVPDSEEVIFCMARLRWLVSKEDTCWANPLLSTSCLLTVSCLVSQDTQRAANTRNAPQANWPTMSLCFSSSIASSIGFSSSNASVSTSSLLHNLSSNLTRPL